MTKGPGQSPMSRYNQGTPNYVTPIAPGEIMLPAVRRPVALAPSAPLQLPAPAATTEVILRTDYSDRARGWLLAVTPLAAVGGLAGLLLAIVGFAVPLFSVAALLVYFAVFAGVWLLGYIAHTVVSPDGIALVHTLCAWRYLEKERRERRSGGE